MHLSKPKSKIQKNFNFFVFCGNYTTLYIHTSEWLKLLFLLQLLFPPIQRSRQVVSPPGSPLLYTVLFCFYLDYLIPSILLLIAFLFVCLLVRFLSISLFFLSPFFSSLVYVVFSHDFTFHSSLSLSVCCHFLPKALL